MRNFHNWPEQGLTNHPDVLYKEGYAGWVPLEVDTSQLQRSLTFEDYQEVQVAYDLVEGPGKYDNWTSEPGLYLPFMAVVILEGQRLGRVGTPAELSQDPLIAPWGEVQQTGDCVAHARTSAVEATYACECLSYGNIQDWRGQFACEPVYGYRRSPSGMSVARAIHWYRNVGGIIERRNYPELGLDFTYYDAQRSIDWRGKLPGELITEGSKHPVRDATRVTSVQQLKQAYRQGLSVGGGSHNGYSATRNLHGVSELRGQWRHDQQSLGYDERKSTLKIYGEPLVLEINSWGAWNNGPRKIRDTELRIPVGSCWVRLSAYRRKLETGECFVVASVDGWDKPPLPNWGFFGARLGVPPIYTGSMPQLRVTATVRNEDGRITYGLQGKRFTTTGAEEVSGVLPMTGAELQIDLSGLSSPGQAWLRNTDPTGGSTIQIGKATGDYFAVVNSSKADATFELDPSVTTLFVLGAVGTVLRYQIFSG